MFESYSANRSLAQVEGVPMRLQLWDTAGQERFRSLTANFFGRADGCVLCYDISHRPSFADVLGLMRYIKKIAPPDCDISFCGTNSDLATYSVSQIKQGNTLADD